MPTFTLTPEQEAILALGKAKPNLIINALAGAAKTSTLTLLAKKLPLVPGTCLAFNKAIATEMAKRMPSHIECSTMNSVGHRAWGARSAKRLIVNSDKLYDIMSEMSKRVRPEQKTEIGETFAQMLRFARMAKAAGYVPRQMHEFGRGLITQDELINALVGQLDCNVTGTFIDFVDEALVRSITLAFEGNIDFDDQPYMSSLFGGKFTQYPIVMVDEAQDLSPLNHEMLAKMLAPGGRLIAVGDPNQAIYAFRGADADSMSKLKERFAMEEMTLSTSFRCPQAVVRRAQSFVPTMRWPEWAEEGKVDILGPWTGAVIPDGAVVICRNNAPLFRTAMRLIREGRGVVLRKNDIGKALITLMKKIGGKDQNLPMDEFIREVCEWEELEVRKAHRSREDGIRDRAECIKVFCEFGKTKSDAIAYAEHLFASTGPVELMTGHGAKGGEWDTVFHLDPDLIGMFAKTPEAMRQERNLRYVIETRAKKELYLITTKNYGLPAVPTLGEGYQMAIEQENS